jgi:putative DNA primase/helicase
MAQHGIDATPQYFIPDRRWHRFAPTPGRKNQSAAYRIVPDPVAPVWWFRDWRMGGSLVRGQGDAGRELSPEETAAWKKRLKEHQRRAEKERLEGYAIESQRAQERWERAQLAPEDHEYLHHKRVQAHGLRVEDGCLLVPLSDIDGNLWSLLKIFPDGFKLNQEFARASECFYVIGDLKEAKTFSVCEGFATAATIFEATGSPVVSACYAGNLENVAPLLRERYPDATIFVCGDDDWLTKMNGQPHNTGKIAATNAARAINGILALPEFGPARAKGDTDFNDQYLRFGGLDKDGREDGLEAVRQTLLRAWKEHKRAPPEPEPPAAAPPFSEEDIALRLTDMRMSFVTLRLSGGG